MFSHSSWDYMNALCCVNLKLLKLGRRFPVPSMLCFPGSYKSTSSCLVLVCLSNCVKAMCSTHNPYFPLLNQQRIQTILNEYSRITRWAHNCLSLTPD